jgi:hypothetical protein
MKLEIQYDERLIPEIICKCFELFSRSFTKIVIKLAGIKEKAIETKNTKFEVFLVSADAALINVKGKASLFA